MWFKTIPRTMSLSLIGILGANLKIKNWKWHKRWYQDVLMNCTCLKIMIKVSAEYLTKYCFFTRLSQKKNVHKSYSLFCSCLATACLEQFTKVKIQNTDQRLSQQSTEVQNHHDLKSIKLFGTTYKSSIAKYFKCLNFL